MSFAKATRFKKKQAEVTPSPADYYITRPLDKGVTIPVTGRDENIKEGNIAPRCDRLNRSNRTSRSVSSQNSLTSSEDSRNTPFKRSCSTRSKSNDAFSRHSARYSLKLQSPQKVCEKFLRTNTTQSQSFSQGEAKTNTPFVRSCCNRRSKSTDALSFKQSTSHTVCERHLRNHNITPGKNMEDYSSFTRGSFLRSSVRKSSRKVVEIQTENIKVPSFEFREEFIDDDYDSFISKEELDDLYKLDEYERDEVIKEMRKLRKEILNSDNEIDVTLEEEKKPKKNKKNKKSKSKQVPLLDQTVEEADMTLVPIDYFKTERQPKQGTIMKIIKNAVDKLKKEFKEEICKKTEKKLSELGNIFNEMRLKNEHDIDEKCDYTVSHIAHKIDKAVGKQTLSLEGKFKNIRKSKRFGRRTERE